MVGDIHQPLHSTALLFSVDQFPQGDKGGNSIPLVHGRNLHSLWDGLLGRDSRMRNVEKVADELSDKDRFGDEWKTAGQEMDPIKWADESHAACASVVYSEAILDAVRNTAAGEKVQPIDLPRSYYTRAGEEARRRIVAAGVPACGIAKAACAATPSDRSARFPLIGAMPRSCRANPTWQHDASLGGKLVNRRVRIPRSHQGSPA